MATEHLSTRPAKDWKLLEHLPSGPIKDELIELQLHLEDIGKAAAVLDPLARFAHAVEDESITLATQTVDSLVNIVETGIDSVFHHLNRIFEKEAPGAAGKAPTAEAPAIPTCNPHDKVHDEIVRLKALSSSLVALSMLDQEIELDLCQLEELGKMVGELAGTLQDKLLALEGGAA